MSSGITFSGFNQIDFNTVLNAIMQQESQPLQMLQTKQSSLQTRVTNFTTLSTKVTALQNAATALSSTNAASAYKATVSDSTAVSVTASSTAVTGRYDIVVSELARAQVTASASNAPDADSTPVATGGSITIGGQTISLSASMTLKQLSEAINANADLPARAAVIQASPNSYKLVLTAKSTGQANGFTITNNLTGGAGISFTDTNGDGVSGDSDADNAVVASDAQLTINNIAIQSASNTLDAAIPGATITLFKKDPVNSVAVDVAEDTAATKAKLQTFVSAYNDIVKFMNDQNLAAAKNEGSIGRDPVVRGLRNALRSVLSTEYSTGSPFSYLSQIGVELTRTGTMQINDAVFDAAIKSSTDVSRLLAGTDSTPGVLKSVTDMLKQYTNAQGFLPSAQTQLNAQISRLGDQVARLQDRLAIRRATLQQEFTAADAAMSRLKSQSGSLSEVSL